MIKTKYGSKVSILKILRPFMCNGIEMERVLVLFDKHGMVTEMNVRDLQLSDILNERLLELKNKEELND